MEKPIVEKLSDVDESTYYDFNGFTNAQPRGAARQVVLEYDPVTYTDYKRKFQLVMDGLLYGNSFLTNLTLATPVAMSATMEDIFYSCKAPYRMWKKNEFLFFSPERFVKIENGVISTNPMKGTIKATTPDAEAVILGDRKELAEHVTIVDLLRNDLSIVANDVEVNRFRYVSRIKAFNNELLQVSSEIIGHVRNEFRNRFGDIMVSLLPAGSVSGAPKPSTIQIIREAEGEKRGYYTGVAGLFNGTVFDSCVMIRFIEETPGGLRYRSGGGITTQSDPVTEYNEVLSKIYVPVA